MEGHYKRNKDVREQKTASSEAKAKEKDQKRKVVSSQVTGFSERPYTSRLVASRMTRELEI